VIIGTKGQYIKMAPILLELEKRNYDYLFINTKQHVESLNKMIKLFGTKQPDYEMWNFNRDITKIKEIVAWLGINSLKYTIGKGRKIFKSKGKNILLVHGDAPPVLLGLLLGKFHRIDIGHVEAGCRSHNLLAPFPEEIIRLLADKFSNILFSLSKFASVNLKRKHNRKTIFHFKRNTLFDSIRIANQKTKEKIANPFVLVSLHRFETLQSKAKMEKIVALLKQISQKDKIIFPIHESTKKAFERYNLLHEIKKIESIEIMPLLGYFSFISHVKQAKYFITDGGGPQEESHYLGTPSMILRETAERVWANNYITGFDHEKIAYFLKNYEKYRTDYIDDDYSSSKIIVDILEKLEYVD
jgi:UDP-N-acetylglucosamine 2-epimerase (non-hydrolysing)